MQLKHLREVRENLHWAPDSKGIPVVSRELTMSRFFLSNIREASN